MGESGPFYLTSVAHGHVLARSPNGHPSGVVAQNRGDQDKPQQWMIEQGEEQDHIALRCLSNDEYLHANGGGNWSTVGTGEKQWWKCSGENVTAPQACRLSPVEFPGVFLNHFQGIRVAKGQSMKVHMWQWEQPNEFCLTWYFCSAGSALSGTRPSTEAAEKEAAEKETAPEPSETESKSDDTAKKIEELEKQLASQAKELEEQKERTDKQKAKLNEELEKKLASQAKELEEQKARTDKQKVKLNEQKKKLDEQKAKIDEQKAKLKKQKEGQKAQPKQDPNTLPAPSKKVTVPATNGVAGQVQKDNCKHVVLPPPRKLRRKVVGIVYAQDDEMSKNGRNGLPKTWRDENVRS